LPCIQNEDDKICLNGIHCLALYCLLDLESAKKYLYLFLSIIKNNNTLELVLVSVSVLFDLLVCFGKNILIGNSDEETGIYY
jgi:hypothetical protein